MAVVEDRMGEDSDTRGRRTLANITPYSTRSAVFNWVHEWRDVQNENFSE
jgi:hypothetical protein